MAVRRYLAPHLFAAWASGGTWKAYPHLEYLSWAIAETVSTPGGRLVINAPPGSGKSRLISHWTPTWIYEVRPATKIILGTATTPLARMIGGGVRDEFAQNERLTTRIKAGTEAKDEWETEAGGGMLAVGVDKSVIGRRGHGIIVDDPYSSWQASQSPVKRLAVQNWLTGTMTNRLEPGGWAIVLHHRMHAKDLTDYILTGPDGHAWRHISLPAISAGDGDPIGRPAGAALCPERYTIADYDRIKVESRFTWEPMYQQNPQAMSAGAVYNGFGQRNIRHDIKVREDLPVAVCIDWNLNPGMHVLIGQHDQRTDEFFTLHEIHGPRMSIDGAAREMIALWKSWAWKPTLHLFGDATGVSLTDGKSYGTAFMRHLLAAGVPFRDRIPKSNPGVLESVLALNDALSDSVTGEARYFVHPRCERLIRDFREVVPDEEGKPDKEADETLTHASDTQRYWVHYLRPIRVRQRTDKRTNGSGFVFGAR